MFACSPALITASAVIPASRRVGSVDCLIILWASSIAFTTTPWIALLFFSR